MRSKIITVIGGVRVALLLFFFGGGRGGGCSLSSESLTYIRYLILYKLRIEMQFSFSFFNSFRHILIR